MVLVYKTEMQCDNWVAIGTCQDVCQPCTVTGAVYITHCQLADVKSVEVVLTTASDRAMPGQKSASGCVPEPCSLWHAPGPDTAA